MKSGQKTLTAKQVAYLRELGLSKHAIQLYASLLAHKKLTANEAADQRVRFASAQYRLFYQLEKHGLARRISKRPLAFEAAAPANALPASLALKEARLKQLAQKGLSHSGEDQAIQVRLFVGRKALYDEYAELAASSQRSIREYTIGIAYSEKFVAIVRAAIERGVQIRMVAQQLKPSNYHALHTWRKLGMQVRLHPTERGFHLMIFDDTITIMTFSDPNNTEDRLSIVTNNPTVAAALGKYFEALWREAREIEV